MAEETAITTQPQSRRKEVESFVRDLDPNSVVEWSESDVVEKYLKPTGFEHLAKVFSEQHINGAVLLALEEPHLQELKVMVIGDRIIFLEYLKLLKKHKRDADRSKALWTGVTPVKNCAYHQNCLGFCFHVLCTCCVPTTEWRVTGQGIRWRKNTSSIDCCGEVETQFVDFRFLKDLEIRKQPKFLCCCVGSELLVYADDKDSVSGTRQTASNVAQTETHEPISIFHPEAARAESLIRNAWADTQLVAD
ncbi:uncharacterized protein LOC135333263 [Halichondria panicea]|uniref:uncharacterized protein LOC135333263 n=1 Tax=Halichondria panicea TaxID=6063 RepID=UPI00312BB3FA